MLLAVCLRLWLDVVALGPENRARTLYQRSLRSSSCRIVETSSAPCRGGLEYLAADSKGTGELPMVPDKRSHRQCSYLV